jgi:hypothetical protein
MATDGTPEQPSDASQDDQASGGGFTISGKMLIIGGAGGAALVVVIAVALLFATGVIGGGASGGGGDGGGDILAYIPADAEVVLIMDNRALSSGNLPEDFIEYLEEEGGDELPDFHGALDISDDDVATVALVTDQDGNDALEIRQGDFDFDIIREELEDGLDCEHDDYRGYELWECPGNEFPAVALFEKDGYVVFAVERQNYLEQLLTYKSRRPQKLADAEESEIKEILDQTGGGWLQYAFVGEGCSIRRCEGLAFALGVSDDSDSIPASYAVMFSSERAAAASEDDVEVDSFLEEIFASFDLELDIGEVKAEGEFVVGEGTAEFVEPGSGSFDSGPSPWDSPEELLKQSSEYINKKQWDKLFETCAPSYRSNHTLSDFQAAMRLLGISKLSVKNIQVVESGNRATATYDLVLDGDTLWSDNENEYVRINGVWYDDEC